MKRVTLSIIITAFVIFPLHAYAAIEPRNGSEQAQTFSFTYQDSEYPVNDLVITQWEEPTEFLLNKPTQSSEFIFTESIANFVGQNTRISQQIKFLHYNPGAIYSYLKKLSGTINKPSQEPKLIIENNKATFFTPPSYGVGVNVYETVINTLTALEQNSTSTALIIGTTSPQITLGETNSLGINELISEGVSSFKGSPHNRRFNIKIGVQKEQGVLVAPGEEFSFNKNLGPVEAAEGFLPELVIKKEGTVPELGGGLCQVSSTTFRAAMQAGLPITQRRNHAYAVSYYSPQGTDATIYPGVIDLKFINNTPGTILVWPYFKDENTLIFDFYGTKDSRQVTLQKPLAFDRKPDGSLKATWTREITKDGVTTTDVFKSNYASPALYHKSTTFVTATGTVPGLLQMPKTN